MRRQIKINIDVVFENINFATVSKYRHFNETILALDKVHRLSESR